MKSIVRFYLILVAGCVGIAAALVFCTPAHAGEDRFFAEAAVGMYDQEAGAPEVQMSNPLVAFAAGYETRYDWIVEVKRESSLRDGGITALWFAKRLYTTEFFGGRFFAEGGIAAHRSDGVQRVNLQTPLAGFRLGFESRSHFFIALGHASSIPQRETGDGINDVFVGKGVYF